MPPKSILWSRGDHTEGKHLVLKHYLEAWFPILGMGNYNQRILFIDGFAGPGEYAGGEEGSPLVAMRALAEHGAKSRINAEVVFFFVEKDRALARHLEGLVDAMRPKLPTNAKVHVAAGSFSSQMSAILDQLEEQRRRMAPAFVMIDPFGVKGIPLSVIRRILGNPKCEVYISFMWEAMNRFLSRPAFAYSLTELFGTDAWKHGNDLDPKERRRFLYDLYNRQLKKSGAQHVVHFDLFKGRRLKYSIFFGTGHIKGCDRMKQAIWKVAPFGDFGFRGGEQDQMVLLGVAKPDFAPLRSALMKQFGDAGWISIRNVLDFVKSDATIYHGGQVKMPVLKPMEQTGLLDVDPDTRKRNLTYPDGCRMRFRKACTEA